MESNPAFRRTDTATIQQRVHVGIRAHDVGEPQTRATCVVYSGSGFMPAARPGTLIRRSLVGYLQSGGLRDKHKATPNLGENQRTVKRGKWR